MRGKQISEAQKAPMTAADVAASAPNTLGGFLKGLAANGVPKIDTMPAIVASADGSKATNSTLSAKPLSLPTVTVNDSFIGRVGDGTKAGVAFYVSGDNGATPRALAAMVAGDAVYANPSVLGYPLDAADTLYTQYQA